MNIAVVGSGMSGLAAAHALISRGARVTILDVGEALEARREAIVAKLHALPTPKWPAADLDSISENRTGRDGALPKKLWFGSDRIYADDRPFAPIVTMLKGRVPYPTFARGGFSNVWGAAVLPVDACDMSDWPVTREQLDPYFQRVVDLLPLCGGAGTLSRSFPAYRDRLGELDPSPQGRALLDDLAAAQHRLSAASFLYGGARLAIHTESNDSTTLPCNGCGHCFAGCVRGSIYSTIPQLDALAAAGRVEYRSGIYVRSVDDRGGEAIVDAEDLARRETVRLVFDAVFLAGGPLNTTRVLLRSGRLFGRTVVLKESQKFALPLVRLRGAETAIEHPAVTLASVFVETKVPALSNHWLHAQIVPLYQMILDGAPIPGKSNPAVRRLWTPVLRRLMVAWCGMHSDHSSRVELTLREGAGAGSDRLELNLTHLPEALAAARAAARELTRTGLLYKTLFLPPMMKVSNPGSGTHCGSSFPMRRTPSDDLDTDALGRPFGWSRVFAVDASVLPSIPGTTLVLSAMANAYRIASEAPLAA